MSSGEDVAALVEVPTELRFVIFRGSLVVWRKRVQVGLSRNVALVLADEVLHDRNHIATHVADLTGNLLRHQLVIWDSTLDQIRTRGAKAGR